ncbi:MAG: DNA polymerase III subunit beta [Planctomycetes bacterium RBG_13_46_10]|nr:MAG: DNA polymerase III subunit beta [Planctomycetes bacterium RBG_13_46_10]
MKVSFNKDALAEALGLLTNVVPARTPKPILRCVHISAGDKDVRISATDLETGISCFLSEVQIDEGGDIVIQADKLAGIVRESSESVLAVKADKGTCEIIGADSHFTIYGQEPEHYPVIPLFEGEADITMPLEGLQAGVEQCLFATAKETSRYAINGVLWEFKGKKLLLVATDGRRLARTRVSLSSSPNEKISTQKVIVPAKAMSLIAKISTRDKESLAVKFIDNQVIFKYAGIVISSVLVEGKFPNYEDIIPSEYTNKLTLSTEAVLSATRRAALLTSEESRGIKLSIGKEAIEFSSRAPEAGDAQVTLPVEYAGKPIDIGFNPQFLIDALRVIKTSDFELLLGQADTPGLIKSGADFLYVLMPISLG